MQLSSAVRALLDGAHPGVLATINDDGSPQTSVVWLQLDGDDVVISSQAGRREERNVEREPRVSLTVYDVQNHLSYVEVRGTAKVAEDKGRAVAVTLAEKYAGPGAGQEYLEVSANVIRAVIRISACQVAGSVK